jgi:hypothetical protein
VVMSRIRVRKFVVMDPSSYAVGRNSHTTGGGRVPTLGGRVP